MPSMLRFARAVVPALFGLLLLGTPAHAQKQKTKAK